MDVLIEKTGAKSKLTFEGKVSLLLLKLKINPETVLVIRDNILITEDDILKDKDSIKIISVISGG